MDGTERCIDDELPFEIPETWKWIRLGTLFQHNTGKALNASNMAGQKLTYITTSNLYWDRFVLDSLKEMFFTDSEIEKCTVQQGDLLVCEGGDIGRAAIWNYNMPMRIQNHILYQFALAFSIISSICTKEQDGSVEKALRYKVYPPMPYIIYFFHCRRSKNNSE